MQSCGALPVGMKEGGMQPCALRCLTRWDERRRNVVLQCLTCWDEGRRNVVLRCLTRWDEGRLKVVLQCLTRQDEGRLKVVLQCLTRWDEGRLKVVLQCLAAAGLASLPVGSTTGLTPPRLHMHSYYIIIMTSLPVRSTPGLTPHRLQMRGYYIMNMTSLPVGSRLLGRSYVKDLKLFLGDFQLYHRHRGVVYDTAESKQFLVMTSNGF